MIKPVFKRTKILATIGPATNNYEAIKTLIANGVNGCRLNFSHGDYEERKQQIAWIRQASEEIGKPVAIVEDLQGPKIRLGSFNDGKPVEVKKDQNIILDNAIEIQQGDIFPIQYNLATKVKVGEPIFIFDGKIKAEVVEIISETAIKILIKNDGVIMSRKGINLPETDFAGDIITEKDLRDIEFGATQDIDYVALSFIQSAEDIQNLRQILLSHGSDAQIIAKIETKQAIQPKNMEEIVNETDAIMVARGDLAIEVGAEVVPSVQDQLIRLCRQNHKLVIVATQMLGSMTDSPQPTRAEASDVATAVMQGADTVMLSDETANGQYPLETVKAMKQIILYTQHHASLHYYNKQKLRDDHDDLDAICFSAVKLAENVNAQAIVVETSSGTTASRVASLRPNRVIISVSESKRSAQQLALSYANQSYIRPLHAETGAELILELKQAGRFPDEQIKVVLTRGRQTGVAGTTDNIVFRTI